MNPPSSPGTGARLQPFTLQPETIPMDPDDLDLLDDVLRIMGVLKWALMLRAAVSRLARGRRRRRPDDTER